MYAFRDEGDLPAETALKLACGLGAGMGRRQEVCGAVTGGILVIGARYGSDGNGDRAAMETTYAKTNTLMDRFAKQHGSVICRQLLQGCNLTIADGQRHFMENDYMNRICVPCVRSVATILEDLIRQG